MLEPNLCPFCGHDHPHMSYVADQHEWFMACENCRAIGPSADNPNAALTAWNRRYDEREGKVQP